MKFSITEMNELFKNRTISDVKINEKLFKDVVIYSFAEVGAMGTPGIMEFVTKDGRYFQLNYFNEKTSYAKIKENFPDLKDCYWNGPMNSEQKNSDEVVIYNNEDSFKHTTITKGWKHIYTGCGNHLVIREDKYKDFMFVISDLDLKEGIYIDAFWVKKALELFGNNNA